MANQTVKRENLLFDGVDDWDRLVFKHMVNGCYFCTVDTLWGNGDDPLDILAESTQLYCKSPAKDFEGEPSFPVTLI